MNSRALAERLSACADIGTFTAPEFIPGWHLRTMMRSVTTSIHPLTRSSRRVQRGQSIVIALLVLLLLGLVGALFVTIVARNLVNARRANRVVTADYYARAGITFADAQLTFSPDGADWRPPLQFAVANPPTETREMNRYNSETLSPPNPNDPDKEYLDAGYARYNTGAGRFFAAADV